MDWNQQVRYLGVSDSTPKTPLPLDGKCSHPFDSKFSSNPSSSSGNSNTGRSSSSRHQVAEPSTSQMSSSTKRNKGHQSHSHDKIPNTGSTNLSREPGTKSSKSTLGMDEQKERSVSSTDSKVSVQPTNILRVSKSKRATIKPYKSSVSTNEGCSVATSNQKATSLKSHSSKEGGDYTLVKHRPKKSRSSSQLQVAADNSTTNPSTGLSAHTSTTHAHSLKSRKEASLPPSSSSVHDSLSHHSNTNPTVSTATKEVAPLKCTDSAGTTLLKVVKDDHSCTDVHRGELRTETPVVTGAVKIDTVKKKEKRIKKKPKKDKGHVYKEKMDIESSLKQEHPLANEVIASNHMISKQKPPLTNQVTVPHHMTSKGVPTTENQMITDISSHERDSSPPSSFKVQVTKQRPSDLAITSMNEVYRNTVNTTLSQFCPFLLSMHTVYW